MKVLRRLLQLIILSAGGITLAALISNPTAQLADIAVLSGFVAFLFALTLVLKGHTEKRLYPSHKLSLRPIGAVLILLGAFGVFYGIGFLSNGQSLPDGSGRCGSICGLILLASQLFGDSVARLAAFILWAGLGLLFCFIGVQMAKTRPA
ncbi:hypothetical protein ACMYUJ_14800 [Stutzerimonas zhaodongensis]|uniref:hypothetical protein n=1 Tax=Stutzerimonas zhaodongensis TaxID=1176257 RepID=UPI0039EF31F7